MEEYSEEHLSAMILISGYLLAYNNENNPPF